MAETSDLTREAGETAAVGPRPEAVALGPEAGERALPEEVMALRAERDALREREAALSAQAEELAERLRALEETVSDRERELREARDRALAHLRRALLAEHAGQVVPELVQGDTAEALEASVAVARSAFAAAVEAARAGLVGQHVPASNGTRTGEDLEELSPVQKIARGLRT